MTFRQPVKRQTPYKNNKENKLLMPARTINRYAKPKNRKKRAPRFDQTCTRK